MADASSSAEVGRMTFELENNVHEVDNTAIYTWSEEEEDRIHEQRPWRDDPHFFKKVRLSAVALVKMVIHTRSAGKGVLGNMNEVMGLMQGKVTPDGTFIILDTFPLPVEGTETTVNAGAAANVFMVTYQEQAEKVGKRENICGWYHSHPNYGCWLSGTDVQTQMQYQRHQDPFLAIVIDPIRTCATGKVEIGAFRTYPEGYSPPDKASEYQSIPLDKIEDFGVHLKQYYQMPVETFKNTLDTAILELLWNKYWIDTLSSSSLLNNRIFANKLIQDCVQKLEQIDGNSQYELNAARSRMRMAAHDPKKKEDNPLRKVAIDASMLAGEQIQGLCSQVVKYAMFQGCRGCRPQPAAVADASSPVPMET